MGKTKYRTLKGFSTGEYKEKGSKFIGLAVPCNSEEYAKSYLAEWRKEHHQSRHLCYAYRLGYKADRFRANDDGEPSNSAGAPILGQLQSFELTNVLVGVIRYYGGTKLGVGGLIHAYRTAAKEAIEAGEIEIREVQSWYNMTFEYSAMTPVMELLKRKKVEISEREFAETCRITVALPLENDADLRQEFESIDTVEMIALGIR